MHPVYPEFRGIVPRRDTDGPGGGRAFRRLVRAPRPTRRRGRPAPAPHGGGDPGGRALLLTRRGGSLGPRSLPSSISESIVPGRSRGGLMPIRTRRGFTLIELLVVIAIIAVLI